MSHVDIKIKTRRTKVLIAIFSVLTVLTAGAAGVVIWQLNKNLGQEGAEAEDCNNIGSCNENGCKVSGSNDSADCGGTTYRPSLWYCIGGGWGGCGDGGDWEGLNGRIIRGQVVTVNPKGDSSQQMDVSTWCTTAQADSNDSKNDYTVEYIGDRGEYCYEACESRFSNSTQSEKWVCEKGCVFFGCCGDKNGDNVVDNNDVCEWHEGEEIEDQPIEGCDGRYGTANGVLNKDDLDWDCGAAVPSCSALGMESSYTLYSGEHIFRRDFTGTITNGPASNYYWNASCDSSEVTIGYYALTGAGGGSNNEHFEGLNPQTINFYIPETTAIEGTSCTVSLELEENPASPTTVCVETFDLDIPEGPEDLECNDPCTASDTCPGSLACLDTQGRDPTSSGVVTSELRCRNPACPSSTETANGCICTSPECISLAPANGTVRGATSITYTVADNASQTSDTVEGYYWTADTNCDGQTNTAGGDLIDQYVERSSLTCQGSTCQYGIDFDPVASPSGCDVSVCIDYATAGRVCNAQTCAVSATPTEPGDIEVVKEGASCVERIAPNNVANFTITGTVTGGAQQVTRITDSLPVGFTYVANSARISVDGGAATAMEPTSSTQTQGAWTLVWTPTTAWTVSSRIVLTFSATATTSAVTGTNINEVSIELEDGNPGYDELPFEVAQTCNPQTGITDSIAVYMIPVALMVISAYIYKKEWFMRLPKFNVQFGDGEMGRMITLKMTKPRDYYEEKVKSKLSKSSKK